MLTYLIEGHNIGVPVPRLATRGPVCVALIPAPLPGTLLTTVGGGPRGAQEGTGAVERPTQVEGGGRDTRGGGGGRG